MKLRWTCIAALLLLVSYCALKAAEPSPGDVFTRRIMPIFKSPRPSSCVQCHLAGVELKDYILPDAEKTFRSLRDQGLIDLDNPEKSKIVTLIDMGGNVAKGPAAVNEKLRKAEREAFLAWISACAADPKLRTSPKLAEAERARPAIPAEVIRHGRKDRVLESFEKNVWSWRFRCMSCHSEGTPQNEKFRAEYGDRVAWMKKAGPEATLDYVISSRLIDTANPDRSLLLRKPLGENHKGGLKFAVGDEAYKGFRTWIEDVSAIRGGKYSAANELPRDAGPQRFGTDLWLKVTDCPAEWGGKLLQVRLFAWDAGQSRWEDSPLAVSDRLVAAQPRLWQHNITLLALKDSTRAKKWQTSKPSLPSGKYLLRAYVDLDGKLAKDWKAVLSEADFAGETSFQARWQEGYGNMTAVRAPAGKK